MTDEQAALLAAAILHSHVRAGPVDVLFGTAYQCLAWLRANHQPPEPPPDTD